MVFAGLLQQFNGQVANITTIANAVQQSFTAARRVFEVLDTPSEVANRPNASSPGPLKGGIEFDWVTFGYTANHPGSTQTFFQSCAGNGGRIFGLTGSGKSSLLSLIPRFL